ncbi:two-component system, NtrC family, response regulator HydG [Tangfeifania diversioriginum]|uniref:Two-component system, NtrC family, response regulator HydG n=1 Tax=Tangfeifania diversioriginum TaxID=1168035 RepID=A0A1M6NE45_9BACT|nr:sigma-54 dependent transcriptional regulator [Tangfeifania diversioriginum]SHJ94022.1 two-component system, NtrC family, response regulator HydG [Tangfeifania diversioriginum]
MAKILIIDDDVTFCLMLKALLEKSGYKVSSVFSTAEAKRKIEKQNFEIVFTDLRLPDTSGMELIKLIKKKAPKTQIIMMTGYADIATAIESIKKGAFNYIPKPLNPDEVLNLVREALDQAEGVASEENQDYSSLSGYFEGVSRPAQSLKEYIDLVSPTPMSVLIVGESGTGKEYAARKVHELSKRADKPFVAVDCGAIPSELVASEFFGHVKGSFTGAISDKTGYFEAASGGTLFLDEVGNLSYNTQIQLLRVLQERHVKPVGSNQEIPIDVRVIAATNEDLLKAHEKGRFREDLYHRLNEFQLNIPPLRERKTDILLYANHFLEQANSYLQKSVDGFDENVERAFIDYHWPGNLREMKNIVKRATLLARGKFITKKEIPAELFKQNSDDFALFSQTNEVQAIQRALKTTDYNKSEAARLLKIDRKTLYNKLKYYNISLPD